MACDVRSIVLRSWPDHPLPLSDLHEAALSPAQDILLLLSRSGAVLSLYLGVCQAQVNKDASYSRVPTPLPLLDNVRSFAWAQCETDGKLEQLIFTAAAEGFCIFPWSEGNLGNGSPKQATGHTEEVEDLADRSSPRDPESDAGCLGSRKGAHLQLPEAQLEDVNDGLCLHHTRASSGQIDPTRVSSSSLEFLRLIKLGLKQRSRWQLNGDETMERHMKEGSYGILKIVSCPSHKIVALIFGKEDQPGHRRMVVGHGVHDEVASRKGSSEDWVKSQSRGPFSGREPFVVLALVQSWGVRFVACDTDELEAGEVENDWVDFALSSDILVGLRGGGKVSFWGASSGKALASLDVSKHCYLHHREDERSVTHETRSRLRGKNIVWSGFSRKALWMEKPEDLPKRDKCLEDNLGASQVAKHSPTVRHFEHLAVSPDCHFLAARDVHGFIFVVSLDDHLAAALPNWQQREIGGVCHPNSLEVASIDIGRCIPAGSALQRWWLERPQSSKFLPADSGHLHGENVSKAVSSSPTTLGGVTCDRPFGLPESLRGRQRAVFCTQDDCSFKGMALSPFEIKTVFHSVEESEDLSIVQNDLFVWSGVADDSSSLTKTSGLGIRGIREQRNRFQCAMLEFKFRGFPYFVTATGLHAFLPPVAVGSGESIMTRPAVTGQWWPTGASIQDLIDWGNILEPNSRYVGTMQKWQAEILDRALIYDGVTESEQLCVENGWSLSLFRLRRLELGLSFMQIDEIEQALEALIHARSAEQGVPRELFAAIELMIRGFVRDKDLSRSLRLLGTAALLATRLIHQQWLITVRRHQDVPNSEKAPEGLQLSSDLTELAGFLELVRSMQERLHKRSREPYHGLNEHGTRSGLGTLDEQPASRVATRASTGTRLEIVDQSSAELLISERAGKILPLSSSLSSHTSGNPRLLVKESVTDAERSQPVYEPPLFSEHMKADWHIVAVENSGDMFARWKTEGLDATAVVKDALQAGRVPLAVVQLQALYAQKGRQVDSEDAFREVQDIGRSIVYEMMLGGKVDEAIATLCALGEDVETALRELAFGTTRRELRDLASIELQKHGWLSSFEAELLEKIHQLEAVYPLSSFRSAYNTRRKHLESNGETDGLQDGVQLGLSVGDRFIQCGEVDAVVLGSWDVKGHKEGVPAAAGSDEQNPLAGYFSAAAIWLSGWDQATFDRVLLDQPGTVGYSVPWQTKLTYHVAHHSWDEVSSLLDDIPSSAIQSGQLTVTSNLDQNAFELVIPEVQILCVSIDAMFTSWLQQMVEDKLLRKGVFLRTAWNGTTELVALLARGERLFSYCDDVKPEPGLDRKTSECDVSREVKEVDLHPRTIQAVQQLMVLHCVEHSLPRILALHVDRRALNEDREFAAGMLAVAGDCHWARWLLFFFMKGFEYSAFVENAKAMVAAGSRYFNCTRVDDVDVIFRSFRSLSDAAGETLALANLVYTPVPLRTYLWSGLEENSFSLSSNSLSQNRTTKFPTLWKLLSEFLDDGSREPDLSFRGAERATSLHEYLSWRKGLFSSSCKGISLMGMLPPTFPRKARRLIQLSTEPDPEELLKLTAAPGFIHMEDGPSKWEALIKAAIKEELYIKVSEELESKVLYYLRRGRGLAAFEYVLNLRLENLKPEDTESSAVLSALTPSEQKLVSPVIPLVIREYANMRVVAACILFLELCGVSAYMVRIVVQSLQRISQYLQVVEDRGHHDTMAISEHDSDMRRMEKLVEDYISEVMNSEDLLKLLGQASTHRVRRASYAILQLLEEATLRDYHTAKGEEGHGVVPGEATSSGRPFSEQWCLVTAFCHVHSFPVSCKYLIALAKDNNWVDFLAQAQIQECSLEVLIPLALNFTDKNLRSHILIVLKSLPSNLPKAADAFLSEEDGSPEELFTLIAKCEKANKPAKALLQKAKDLKWALLPVVATCYDQVDPLLCLDVWLEIVAQAQGILAPESILKSDGFDEKLDDYDEAAADRASKKQKTGPSQSTEEPTTESAGIYVPVVETKQTIAEQNANINDLSVDHRSLASKVSMFCERQQFVPLLRGFELFSPASSLLPFIKFVHAFSQMRLSDASALLMSFSGLLRDELQQGRQSSIWMINAAISAADAMLDACPSPYERRCLLQLLSAADFGDGGAAAVRFRRLYWKMQLAEPSLQESNRVIEGGTSLEDEELLTALEKQGRWEDARIWAKQLDLKVGLSSSAAVHSVTETQAESIVTDWKQLLWDFPAERAALWGHCESLFKKHSFPSQRAGMFFFKHGIELEESDLPPSELHEVFLLAFERLCDRDVNFPADVLEQLETRVWMLAVEAEAEITSTGSSAVNRDTDSASGFSNSTLKSPSIFEKTQAIIATAKMRLAGGISEGSSSTYVQGKQRQAVGSKSEMSAPRRAQPSARNSKLEDAVRGWQKTFEEPDTERAILSLLEAGQLAAAKQLQGKVPLVQSPIELPILIAAHEIAMDERPVVSNCLQPRVVEHLRVVKLVDDVTTLTKSQTLDILTSACREGCGQGFCRRIAAVAHIASSLELSFSEVFRKQPTELLQLLTLRGQDALAEAELLVATHTMAAGSIARILAESFLKGLVAAHRGGYLNASLKEEGPAPLLWRSSDFERWAQLCPSQPEVGHALMRLVISGQDMPLACEVELMILAHRFYEVSACLDGQDVLVALATSRVELYVAKKAFGCLARLLTGVTNFHTWRFVLDLLIENDQLDLLLRTYTESGLESAPSNRGFRLAVLSALKRFNAQNDETIEHVYSHFGMNHELADLKRCRAQKRLDSWVSQNDLDRSEDLLVVMKLFVEAAQLYAAVEAGNHAKMCCATASLISLQLRMPEQLWLNLSETSARRLLVEQPRFEEALIVAEAYGLNQPAEWVPVIWNHMLLYPHQFHNFLNDFAATLPLTKEMFQELTRFYRAEVAARGNQMDFTKWLTPPGVQSESSLAKAFRTLLNHVHDIRLRIQLAIMATGFPDVVDTCSRLLDRVPEGSGPIILKRGEGGEYLPMM